MRVIQGPHAANAEPADQPALVVRGSGADQKDQHGFGDVFKLDRESHDRFRDECMGFAGIGGGSIDILAVHDADRLFRRFLAARSMLDASHRDARGEHGQKPVTMNGERHTIRQDDQAKREKSFEAERLPVTTAQERDEPSGGEAEQPACAHAGDDAPCDAADHAPVKVRIRANAAQKQAECRTWVGRAVVDPTFAGQRKTHQFDVACVAHADVMSEHGVHRRDHRAQQYRDAETQMQHQHAERGDRRDGEDHRDDPTSPMKISRAPKMRHPIVSVTLNILHG